MMQGFKTLCTLAVRTQIQIRSASTVTKALIKERQNEIFDKEKERQFTQVGRIEKINVQYLSPTDEVQMMMNKNLSTPHDCAKHISEGVAKVSVVALVDDVLWDMHRPLPKDCTLRFLNMRNPEKMSVNATYWRSCSFLLGAVIDSAFKDNIELYLHSFPWPNIKAGSFVHDAFINLPDWKPTEAELKALSATFVKLVQKELPFERLQISEQVALDMFKDNPFKVRQIPDIADKNEDSITVYRVGNHIDISKGPMIGNTANIGRCTISAVHKIQLEDMDESLYRFQGVSVPSGIMINHFAYGILEERARKLNDTTWMPVKYTEQEDTTVSVAAQN